MSAHSKISNIVGHVNEMLSKLPLKQDRPSGNFEFECRLGKIVTERNTTRFESGVQHVFFDKCVLQMMQFKGWATITDWIMSQDSFYTITKTGEDSRDMNIRTSSSYHALGEGMVTHTCKSILNKSDFMFVPSTPSSTQGYDLRVALNYEEHIPLSFISAVQKTQLVRLKTRKTFVYSSRKTPSLKWNFDFSISHSGVTFTDAEKNQKNNTSPRYEIEIECVNLLDHLNHPDCDQVLVATSMLLKMADLLGPDSKFMWIK